VCSSSEGKRANGLSSEHHIKQTAVPALGPPFFVSLAPSSNPSYKTPPRYSGDQKVDINFLGRQG
jgi:hypothetical protein